LVRGGGAEGVRGSEYHPLVECTEELELTRKALHIRRREMALGDGDMAWRDDLGLGDEVLAFERPPIDGSPAVLVIVNTGQSDVEVPNAGALLVASQPTIERTAANTLVIPSDTTVWLRA